MKNYRIAAVCLTLAVSISLTAQHRADRQSLNDENSFSMILLGDPEGYT